MGERATLNTLLMPIENPWYLWIVRLVLGRGSKVSSAILRDFVLPKEVTACGMSGYDPIVPSPPNTSGFLTHRDVFHDRAICLGSQFDPFSRVASVGKLEMFALIVGLLIALSASWSVPPLYGCRRERGDPLSWALQRGKRRCQNSPRH